MVALGSPASLQALGRHRAGLTRVHEGRTCRPSCKRSKYRLCIQLAKRQERRAACLATRGNWRLDGHSVAPSRVPQDRQTLRINDAVPPTNATSWSRLGSTASTSAVAYCPKFRLAKQALEHGLCVWPSVQRSPVREIPLLPMTTFPGTGWRSPDQAARRKAHRHWVAVPPRHALDIARCRTKPTCRLDYGGTTCRPFYLALDLHPASRPPTPVPAPTRTGSAPPASEHPEGSMCRTVSAHVQHLMCSASACTTAVRQHSRRPGLHRVRAPPVHVRRRREDVVGDRSNFNSMRRCGTST